MRAACLLLLLSAALPAQAGPRLVDRVVAVIAPGGAARRATVITLSELEIEARIALIRAGGTMAASGEIPPEALAATLDQLIAEHLLQAEAEELAVVAVDPAEERAALQAFEARFPSAEEYRAFLERWELTDRDVGRALRRGIVVDRYLASRARLGVSVPDAELRRAWQARGGTAEGYAAVREGLRAEAERKKREELVAALVADLRSRAQVRVVHDLVGRRAGPPPATEETR